MNPLKVVTEALEIEAKAIEVAKSKIDQAVLDKLVTVFELLVQTGGNLIFSGVGKSGIVANKLASTFSSLGQPSFFLQPNEALHGDLGRITKADAIVWISNSATTEEILKLIPFVDISPEMSIGLLGNPKGKISDYCSIVFDCAVEKEACLNNLAPTSSTTVAMAMGDAMAVLYESYIGLTKEKYAKNHPGGFLGKSLKLKVQNLLVSPEDCPVVTNKTLLKDIIIEMTAKPIGACAVLDDSKKFQGIIVEGDIRRALTKSDNALELPAESVMTKKPVSTSKDELAYDVFKKMESRERPIYQMPVLEGDKFLGLIRMHDLWKEGF